LAKGAVKLVLALGVQYRTLLVGVKILNISQMKRFLKKIANDFRHEMVAVVDA
jgi:hypothetical protein